MNEDDLIWAGGFALVSAAAMFFTGVWMVYEAWR
jgi:ABC-type transporter Mla subunit MlaD